MSLSRKERDQLAEVIQRENEMVLKVGRMVRNAFILTLAFGAVTSVSYTHLRAHET